MSAIRDRRAKAVFAKTGFWGLAGSSNEAMLHRFVVLPKRWIVERTFAWISRNRRLARDFERYAKNRRRLLSASP